jgi:predicted Fe-Mo cluster-binding NifX family protein
MKVAISATGNDLEAQVDPAFGRCKYFIINVIAALNASIDEYQIIVKT